MLIGRLLRRGAAVAVLVFSLAACGGDDNATEAGVPGDDGSEGSSASVAETATDTSPDEGDEHADEGDGHADEGDGHDDEGDGHDDEGDEHDDEGDEHDDEGDGHDDEGDGHDDEGGSSGGLGAHAHGVAELSLAWNEGEVFVDLISPTHNIFGFEHEPSTDEERSLVADRTDALSEPGVIALNSEAGCELVGEVGTELEFEGSHAELTASWLFNCEHPDEIRHLDVAALFAEFANLQDIDAQWVSPLGQSAAELSPSSTVLSLK